MMILSAAVFAAVLKTPLFYNIAPCQPGKEVAVAEDMKEYVRRTGNRKILYMLSLHPEGVPVMAKVDKAMASYRRFKEALKGSDIELGVLLQSILGHWPRMDKKSEPWQRTIDQSGNAVRYCRLDPRYRDYIFSVAKSIAAEKPGFILADDDIRANSPGAECFCPLHLAEFNRRCGTVHTSAEMRSAVAASKPGEKVFEVFLSLQREQVDGVARLIREGIDSVDPSIPAGTCMPAWEYRFNHATARAIAAAGHPGVMRIANSNYQERGDQNRGVSTVSFAGVVQKTQSYYAYHKDKVDVILTEADTYPHHLWSRSSTSWHAHLAMSLFTGLKGAKLWYVNASRNSRPINRNYTDVLAENAGFYRTLVAVMDGAEPLGLVEPCLVRFPTWHPLRLGGENFVPRLTWAKVALGRLGVPFSCDADYSKNNVWTLAGEESVSRMTDEDIRKILSHRVLVDGTAALALSGRGFSELIGVSAREDPQMMFNSERDAVDGTVCRLFRSDKVPRLTALKGARELTSLMYASYSGASDSERVAPGTVFFTNGLGGKVVVTAWHLEVFIDQVVNEARQDWISKIIGVLDGDIPQCMNRQDVTMLAARAADGAVLLAVFNLNYDPIRLLELKVGGEVRSVEMLKGDGGWQAKKFGRRNGMITIPCDLPCYGTAVLRLVSMGTDPAE